MAPAIYALYKDGVFVRAYRTEGLAKNGRTQRGKHYVYDPTTGKGRYVMDEGYEIKKYILEEEKNV